MRHNAQFVADIAREHGSFGKFLAQWPADDQVGLLEVLAKRGARLGGKTGQYFLRFVGRDSFITSADVVACLRDAGLDIAENPTSKKDMKKVQDQFNAWAKETGLPLHPSLPHLLHVGRRELQRRGAARPHRHGRVALVRAAAESSIGAGPFDQSRTLGARRGAKRDCWATPLEIRRSGGRDNSFVGAPTVLVQHTFIQHM